MRIAAGQDMCMSGMGENPYAPCKHEPFQSDSSAAAGLPDYLKPEHLRSDYAKPNISEDRQAEDMKAKQLDPLLPSFAKEKETDTPKGPWPLEDEGAVYDGTKPCACEKCSKRLYQDGSADAGVSFKAPTHIDPAMSRSVVASHEREHVERESYQAAEGNAKVASAQVRLFQRSCSDCGIIYCSGGVSIVKLRPDVPIYELMGHNIDAKA